LPAGDEGSVSSVTDVAWAGDRILATGKAGKQFQNKIYTIAAPLDKDAKANVYSAKTFHVAHNRWETDAPIKTLLPYEFDKKKYVVGAFTCTPLVKYPIDDLKSGDKVQGVSVIELGNGNHPRDMFTYEKDGKAYILLCAERAFGKPFGKTKYWTCRVD